MAETYRSSVSLKMNGKHGTSSMNTRQVCDPKDELMKKFTRNFQKMLDNRSNGGVRTVKFNPQTIETSIGGTQTPGKIKPSGDSTLSDSSISSSNSSVIVNDTRSVSQLLNVFNKPSLQQNGTTPLRPKRISDTPTSSRTPLKCETPARASIGGVRQHNMDWAKHVTQTPDCFNPVSFETPMAKGKTRRSSCEMEVGADQANCGVTVAVRVRPFMARELADQMKCVVSMADMNTTVKGDKGDAHNFTFDYSFWSTERKSSEYAGQEHVYNLLAQPLLGRAFEGYNVCLFAYGQTGSGKSYSIMGHADEVGIIPRFCEELFGRIEGTSNKDVTNNVEISFFEIYNEKIHDLLGPYNKDKTGKKPNLKVREHPLLGPFVEGLSSYVVKSFEDVKGWLSVGNKHRATAATGMNDKSSRSHSVFTMVLTQTRTDNIEGEDHEHSITSKINLVDLAGSERQSQAKTSGDRLREGSSINKSLLTLGKVISLLSETSQSLKRKKLFIPYRDSVLTWLLKESLGGNSKTAMLATISPAHAHMEETLSTLRYAQQARSIMNIAKVNEDPKARLIRELRGEIEKLRCQTGVASEDVIGASLAEIASLKDKLTMKEKEMQEMTRSWVERLKKSEERKNEEAKLLERSGIAFQVDNRMPNLVNLNEDPQLSEMLLYILKDGMTKVGRMHQDSKHDIQLSGPLIADHHCVINNVDKIVSVTPMGDAPTYVNGNLITGPTVLHHGDRVILGGDHYFRFNHPIEVQKGRKSNAHQSGQLKDFEFARQELIEVQTEKLQAELDEAKRKHQAELEAELERQRSVAKAELERERQEANQELNTQKHEYEDRLAELEKALQAQRQEKQESEHGRQNAQDTIRKLELEKQMLEHEVENNRKRLALEAKAAQSAAVKSRIHHSKIVEQLEKETQKIKKDVEAIRQKRGTTPLTTPRLTPGLGSAARTPLNGGADLYRVALLLREANKISQHLNKDMRFCREDVVSGEETSTLVKVTNTKLGISTFWTMDKFEDRLVTMRELFQQSEPESVFGDVADDVFNNPNDTWEKDDRLVSSPGLSKRLMGGLKGRQSIADTAMKLTFDLSPAGKKRKNRLKSGSTSSEMSDIKSNNDSTQIVMALSRDIISISLEKFKGQTFEESAGDKVLYSCEIVKTATMNLLDAFNQSSETSSSRGFFMESEVVQVSSLQLANHINLLLSHCALWAHSYESLGSALIRDLCNKITNTVKKLGNQVVLFLQGCEHDIESLVQESVTQVLDSLFMLCKHGGELALATETSMICLRDTDAGLLTEDDEDEDGQKETDRLKLGHDVRQAFLSGCDMFIDKTLQGGLKTVEDCEGHVQALPDEAAKISKDVEWEDLMKEVEVITACSKVLLQRCQQVQVELDSTMQENLSSESKPVDYYHRSYVRAQGLIAHVSNLTDGISLLVQATETLVQGQEEGSLKKVIQCAEMIQRSTEKLLASSAAADSSSSSSSNSFRGSHNENSDLSVLSDSQLEQLDVAAQEVRLSVATLISIANKGQENGSHSSLEKRRQLLPAYPARRGVAASLKQNSLQRKLFTVDENL